jgi:hypothetical protein
VGYNRIFQSNASFANNVERRHECFEGFCDQDISYSLDIHQAYILAHAIIFQGRRRRLGKANLACVVCIMLITLSVFAGTHYAHASAMIWTDKPDYSPGNTVIISGSGFQANTVITIAIMYPDSSVHTYYAWTDGSGAFNCAYPLDGILGTYTVTATDGTNTATTTFTDKATAILDQGHNDEDNNGVVDTLVTWSGGAIQAQNSLISEGNIVPPYPPNIPGHVNYRMIIDALPAGTYDFVIQFEFTKGGIAAFDFLTTNYGITDANLKTQIPGSVDSAKVEAIVNAGVADTEPFPLDLYALPTSLGGGLVSDRQTAHDTVFSAAGYGPGIMKVYGAVAIGSITQGAHTGPITGDSLSNVIIRITKTSSSTEPILLTWGAHVAIGQAPPAGYGTGNGAGSISGGPFHMYLDDVVDVATGKSAISGGKNVAVQVGAVIAPSVSTTTTGLSAATITLGESITDTATVTGSGPTPTGNVDFQVSTDNGVTWTKFGVTKTLVGGSVTSDGYTPSAAGTYYFRALYGGDGNYQASQSADDAEPLTVTQAGPAPSTTTTLLSASSITLGGSVTDTVTVTGAGPVPTGTVTFEVQIGAGSFAPFSTKSLDGTGHATSDSYTPLAVGSYRFRALYGGDGNYQASQSADDAEPLTVTQAGPATIPTTTVTLLSSSKIDKGGSVTDKVTISTSATGTLPTATGTWTVYAADNSGMTGKVLVGTGSVSGALPFTVTSPSFTPTHVGTWYFQAVYSGDSNYIGSQSTPSSEQLTVKGWRPELSVLPRTTKLSGPCLNSTTFNIDVQLFNDERSGVDVYSFDFHLDWGPEVSLVKATYHSPWTNFFEVANTTTGSTYHLALTATPPSTGLYNVNTSVLTLTFHVDVDVCWPDTIVNVQYFHFHDYKMVADGGTVIPIMDIEVDDGGLELHSVQPNIDLTSTAITVTNSTGRFIIQKCDSHTFDVEVDLTNVTSVYGFSFTLTYDPHYLETNVQKITFKAAFPPPYEYVHIVIPTPGTIEVTLKRPCEKPTVCGALVPAVDIVFHTKDTADIGEISTPMNTPISITDAEVYAKCNGGVTYTYPGGLLYGGDLTYAFTPSRYDLNLDCTVDVQDLKVLVKFYGISTGADGYGDLYADPAHLVNLYDFVAIAKHFGPVDP